MQKVSKSHKLYNPMRFFCVECKNVINTSHEIDHIKRCSCKYQQNLNINLNPSSLSNSQINIEPIVIITPKNQEQIPSFDSDNKEYNIDNEIKNILCEFCKEYLPIDEYENHLNMCEKYNANQIIIPCELCGQFINACDYENHISNCNNPLFYRPHHRHITHQINQPNTNRINYSPSPSLPLPPIEEALICYEENHHPPNQGHNDNIGINLPYGNNLSRLVMNRGIEDDSSSSSGSISLNNRFAERLITIKFEQGQAENLDEQAQSCLICLKIFENGEEIKFLPCIHKFHANCINIWLKGHNTCPLCKKDISTMDRI